MISARKYSVSGLRGGDSELVGGLILWRFHNLAALFNSSCMINIKQNRIDSIVENAVAAEQTIIS